MSHTRTARHWVVCALLIGGLVLGAAPHATLAAMSPVLRPRPGPPCLTLRTPLQNQETLAVGVVILLPALSNPALRPFLLRIIATLRSQDNHPCILSADHR